MQQGGLPSGKKKAHKHKHFCPVGLGTTPGLSRGFHRACPWDKPGFSPYSTQWKPDFTGFVPGTNPGTTGGTESLPPGTKPIHAGKNSWGINFSANTCGACIRTCANTGKMLRSHFLHISQILEGNYFRAYTCRACIRTRANTGKYSWGIIYVLVSCQ